jgi:hypothetical protein
MVTVVNNPPSSDNSGPIGMILVLAVVLILGYLAYVYGLPAVRNIQPSNSGPQINVPSSIDVNIKQTE